MPAPRWGCTGWCQGSRSPRGVGAGGSFLPAQPGEERGAGMSWLQTLLLLPRLLAGASSSLGSSHRRRPRCWKLGVCCAGSVGLGRVRMGCGVTSCPAHCPAPCHLPMPAPVLGTSRQCLSLGHLRLRAGWDPLGPVPSPGLQHPWGGWQGVPCPLSVLCLQHGLWGEFSSRAVLVVLGRSHNSPGLDKTLCLCVLGEDKTPRWSEHPQDAGLWFGGAEALPSPNLPPCSPQ